ncbi:MAG TPA: universal stress protein [Methylocella sp.]|nr:universal stress protein [Methylocella sp.]
MAIKSVWLGLNFEEPPLDHTEETHASETYALELCAREGAHLSVCLAAPIFTVPSVVPGAGLLAIENTPADEVNADRRVRAEAAHVRIASQVKRAGLSAEFHVIQVSYAQLRNRLVASAMPSDLAVLSRSGYYLSLDRGMIEAMLFTSGRPIVLVPPGWEREARIAKIIIAWDGGGRAARAVGDAMPLLTHAEEVEIVCVSRATSKFTPSEDLAAHLARHCKKVIVTDLPMKDGGIAVTLRAHAVAWRADLLVMGAYAHPRMLEILVGGVTNDMFSEAEIPVLLSH